MKRTTWLWIIGILIVIVVVVINYTLSLSLYHPSPPPPPPCTTRCKDIAEHILKCNIKNEDMFCDIENDIISKASDSHFIWTYDEKPTNKSTTLCKEKFIYEIQCIKTVYHMYQIGLVTCPHPSHIHLLPNEQEHLLSLPPTTSEYPRALPFSGDPNYKVRIAYTILLHGHATTFERLIRLLYHPDHIFVVHADKHTPQDELEQIRKICTQYHVHIIPQQFEVYWGAVGIMFAPLATLSSYLQDKEWDFWIQISGVDLPLKSAIEINDFLRPHVGYSFITSQVLGTHNIETEQLYFDCVGEREVFYLINGTTKYKEIIQPFEITWHYGMRGMILSRDAAMYILYHPNARQIIERSRYIYIADEKTFHTIVHNAPELKDFIIPDAHHFHEYNMPELSFFTANNQSNLFARKWLDNQLTRDYVEWFVANKPTFAPP